MEKIAVSSEGPDMDARVDPRFGRAAGFMIIDSAKPWHSSTSTMVRPRSWRKGPAFRPPKSLPPPAPEVLLTGFVGPKAFQALNCRRYHKSARMSTT